MHTEKRARYPRSVPRNTDFMSFCQYFTSSTVAGTCTALYGSCMEGCVTGTHKGGSELHTSGCSELR